MGCIWFIALKKEMIIIVVIFFHVIYDMKWAAWKVETSFLRWKEVLPQKAVNKTWISFFKMSMKE